MLPSLSFVLPDLLLYRQLPSVTPSGQAWCLPTPPMAGARKEGGSPPGVPPSPLRW